MSVMPRENDDRRDDCLLRHQELRGHPEDDTCKTMQVWLDSHKIATGPD